MTRTLRRAVPIQFWLSFLLGTMRVMAAVEDTPAASPEACPQPETSGCGHEVVLLSLIEGRWTEKRIDSRDLISVCHPDADKRLTTGQRSVQGPKIPGQRSVQALRDRANKAAEEAPVGAHKLRPLVQGALRPLPPKLQDAIHTIRDDEEQARSCPDWSDIWGEREGSREPELNDIKQGPVGDCFLQASLAALTVLENGRKMLKDAIVRIPRSIPGNTNKPDHNGCWRYFVKFKWKYGHSEDGVSKEIAVEVLDELFKPPREDKRPKWPWFFREAYRNLMEHVTTTGNILTDYRKIWGGYTSLFQTLVTGMPIQIYRPPHHAIGVNKLREKLAIGPVTISANTNTQGDHASHAYAVMNIVEDPEWEERMFTKVQVLEVGKEWKDYKPKYEVHLFNPHNMPFDPEDLCNLGGKQLDGVSGGLRVPLDHLKKVVTSWCAYGMAPQNFPKGWKLICFGDQFGDGTAIEINNRSGQSIKLYTQLFRNFNSAATRRDENVALAIKTPADEDYRILPMSDGEQLRSHPVAMMQTVDIPHGITYVKPLRLGARLDSEVLHRGACCYDADIGFRYHNPAVSDDVPSLSFRKVQGTRVEFKGVCKKAPCVIDMVLEKHKLCDQCSKYAMVLTDNKLRSGRYLKEYSGAIHQETILRDTVDEKTWVPYSQTDQVEDKFCRCTGATPVVRLHEKQEQDDASKLINPHKCRTCKLKMLGKSAAADSLYEPLCTFGGGFSSKCNKEANYYTKILNNQIDFPAQTFWCVFHGERWRDKCSPIFNSQESPSPEPEDTSTRRSEKIQIYEGILEDKIVQFGNKIIELIREENNNWPRELASEARDKRLLNFRDSYVVISQNGTRMSDLDDWLDEKEIYGRTTWLLRRNKECNRQELNKKKDDKRNRYAFLKYDVCPGYGKIEDCQGKWASDEKLSCANTKCQSSFNPPAGPPPNGRQPPGPPAGSPPKKNVNVTVHNKIVNHKRSGFTFV